jgi:hypothetical protein
VTGVGNDWHTKDQGPVGVRRGFGYPIIFSCPPPPRSPGDTSNPKALNAEHPENVFLQSPESRSPRWRRTSCIPLRMARSTARVSGWHAIGGEQGAQVGRCSQCCSHSACIVLRQHGRRITSRTWSRNFPGVGSSGVLRLDWRSAEIAL